MADTFPIKKVCTKAGMVQIDRYNRVRRHSTIAMRSPVDYELAALATTAAA